MQHKLITITASLCLTLVLQAGAQIKLSSSLSYNTYLQYEPIVVEAQIDNKLAHPLVFNMEAGDPVFYYLVKDANGYVITANKKTGQLHPSMIPPRQSETMTNNILEYYPVHKPGNYSVQPCVDWNGKSYIGEKKYFEVINGRDIDSATGIVLADGSSRRYRLMHVNRKHQDHLLLRIDDEEAHLCYGVFLLGRMITGSKTELAIDADAQAHITFRTSPLAFIYATYSPMGYLVNQQVFGQQYADVDLISRPNGSVVVKGKIDTRRGTDIPKVESIIDKNKMRRE